MADARRPPSHRVQKIMVQPITVIFRHLQQQSRVQVWLYEQLHTTLEGRIVGFDEFMNLVLEDAEEVNAKKQTRQQLGRILLKGDTITLLAEAPAQEAAH